MKKKSRPKSTEAKPAEQRVYQPAENHATPYVDPEVVRKREAYYRDWKERMATWALVQREYMPRYYRRAEAGEYSF